MSGNVVSSRLTTLHDNECCPEDLLQILFLQQALELGS